MNRYEINRMLNEKIDIFRESFHEELSTDENKDYRRGFRAGVLFAHLQIKSDLGNIPDAFNQRYAGEDI